uniref:B box-type domain-containing protein n=1 Tax=Terrapene triunguis TaxID=2587831 RepID=A0A674JXJ0_9SAUR
MKQPFIHKMANVAIPEKSKMKGKACGQCETKNALLVCLECGEDYCGSCFARVHQKGALKLHRMIPLQAKTHVSVGKLEATHQFMKDFNPDESKKNHEQKIANIPTGVVFENQNGGLLLYGTFDEEESAESFQEALTQWRNGNHEHKKEQNSDEAQPESMGVCEVQTHLTILRKPVKIEFKEESLNYMEKLWLKKHRRLHIFVLNSLRLSVDIQFVLFCLVSSARTSTVNHERMYTDCIHSSTEETVLSSPHESAVTEKESIKTQTSRRSLSACMLPEKTFDLPKLGSNEPSLTTRSLKNNKDSLECNSFHTSKSLILPVTTEASVLLQEIALREKPTLKQYQGLEGFFILHANSKQVTLDSIPSPFSDCSSTNSTSGHWFRDTSLSEYADDSVVQDVLQSELSRSLSSLELQNLYSLQRPSSANIPSSKSMKSDRNCCTLSHTRPRNLTTQPSSRAATEISKIECIDVTEQNDPLLEYTADQQALAGLENELKSHTGNYLHCMGTNCRELILMDLSPPACLSKKSDRMCHVPPLGLSFLTATCFLDL